MLQAEQRLPHATEEKEKRSFPVECGSIAKDYPAWNPQRTQKSREVLCPEPEVVPRFSLGDVGEARWLLSHRWTETSPILPDVAHDSRNQRRVVSLSALSLLSECVRSWAKFITSCSKRRILIRSRAQSAPYRRFTCTSLMLRLRVMLNVPSQFSVRSYG